MKKLIAITFAFLLIAQPALAAVTIDSTASGAGADPLSISRTIASGATLDVLLCAADGATTFVTGVTRSTDTYTELTTARASDGTTGISTTIFYMVNPLSGTTDAVASVTGSTEGLGCWGISFFGSDTSTPFSTQTGVMDASEDDATESNSVTAATGEIVIDIIGLRTTVSTGLTAGANQTPIPADPVEDTGQGHGYGGSYQAGADGGVMSWSWTGNQMTAHSIAVVKAAATSRPIAPIIFQ